MKKKTLALSLAVLAVMVYTIRPNKFTEFKEGLKSDWTKLKEGTKKAFNLLKPTKVDKELRERERQEKKEARRRDWEDTKAKWKKGWESTKEGLKRNWDKLRGKKEVSGPVRISYPAPKEGMMKDIKGVPYIFTKGRWIRADGKVVEITNI